MGPRRGAAPLLRGPGTERSISGSGGLVTAGVTASSAVLTLLMLPKRIGFSSFKYPDGGVDAGDAAEAAH